MRGVTILALATTASMVYGSLAECAERHGLTVRAGKICKGGKPYRGIGVNYCDLFQDLIHHPGAQRTLKGLRLLGEKRAPFVRFWACGFWPKDWDLYLEVFKWMSPPPMNVASGHFYPKHGKEPAYAEATAIEGVVARWKELADKLPDPHDSARPPPNHRRPAAATPHCRPSHGRRPSRRDEGRCRPDEAAAHPGGQPHSQRVIRG